MEGQGGAAGRMARVASGEAEPQAGERPRGRTGGSRGTACAHVPECSNQGRKTTRLGSGEWEVVPSFRCNYGCQETPRDFLAEGDGAPHTLFKK